MLTEFVSTLAWTWALSANIGAPIYGALASGMALFVLGGFADPWVSVVLLRNDTPRCAWALMAQCAGGVAGAALAMASGSAVPPNAVPAGATAVRVFAAEAVGAAVKMFAAGKGAHQHAVASSAVALILVPLTSYSGGAARALGLAAVHGAFGRGCWAFFVGPCVGTLVGALAGGLDDALRRRVTSDDPEANKFEDMTDDLEVVDGRPKRVESDATCSSRCKLPYSSEFSGDSAAEARHFAVAEERFGKSLRFEMRGLPETPDSPSRRPA